MNLLPLAGLATIVLGLGAATSNATPLNIVTPLIEQPSPGASGVNTAATPAPPSLAETMKGRPLDDQVAAYSRTATDDEEQDCLANAVYFEARGEPLVGQLAVAEVVLNRVGSERYPDTICDVVKQPWQFSFVRNRRIPVANRSSEAWRRAVAIARIAQDRVSNQLGNDVLWYHADYVSPSWGRRLDRTTKIGLHIFYR